VKVGHLGSDKRESYEYHLPDNTDLIQLAIDVKYGLILKGDGDILFYDDYNE